MGHDWRPNVWRPPPDLDGDLYPCYYTEPVARRDHICEHDHRDGPCGQLIPSGTRYLYVRGIAHGRRYRQRFVTRKICGGCVAVKVGDP